MASDPAQFVNGDQIYHADTCSPLADAANNGRLKLYAVGRRAYPGKRLPKDSLKELCSLGCWDASRDQSWGLEWHRNEGIELTYLDQGKVYFAMDDQEFELLPGNLTITRPWQYHTIGNPNITACRLHWIILDVGVRQPHTPWKWPDWLVLSPNDIQSLTEILRGNEQPVWQATNEIGRGFERIREILESYETGTHESRLKIHINELYLELFELLKTSDKPLDINLSSAQRTVELFLTDLPNLLEMDWSLESMAKHCGMGRSQFSNYCRKLKNRTPMNYLMECRIEMAKRLLKENQDMNITEIAMECGFQNSQYFATQFRKNTGMSPGEFRKNV